MRRPSDPVHLAFSKSLLCVPEHTWGLDTKTHLTIPLKYDFRPIGDLHRLPEYQAMQESWDEQRHYLDRAVDALVGTSMQAQAIAVMQADIVPVTEQGEQIAVNEAHFVTPLFEIGFDAQTGSISHLLSLKDGRLWATADNLA